jgi:UDP-2,3-diacylglucosamine pyrophosphatase LpxH
MIYDTLIVSDVHLGSPASLAEDLHQLLTDSTSTRVILLGDIFSDLNFSRLTKEHWRLISFIRKLSNPKRGVEVVWVEGNHDVGVTQVMEHLIGVKVYQEYAWEWQGKKCLAMHGHQFDALYAERTPWFNGLITEVHIWIQKVPLIRGWLPRILDKLHTRYQRLSTQVEDGAFRRAVQEGASYIFCGHTHAAQRSVRDFVEYWNTGSWVDVNGTYITLGEGGVELHEFKKSTVLHDGH